MPARTVEVIVTLGVRLPHTDLPICASSVIHVLVSVQAALHCHAPPGPNQPNTFPRACLDDLERLREKADTNPIASSMLEALDTAFMKGIEWREKLRKVLVR